MARRNYAGEKWTKEDIRRVENETGRSMKETARRENKELDEMTRQARYERRDNEMSNSSNKSHRLTEEERLRKQQREQAKRAANQDAIQARDALYSNNSRANQRETYQKQNARAAKQDNAQYEQPYYDYNQRSNKRNQEQRAQQRREDDANSRRAAREESNFNRTNQTSRKTAERRAQRGYAKEEAAFNKGRDANRDRVTGARLRNERNFQQATTLAQRRATAAVNPGKNSVPSTNPTAAGGNGRTWKNHKYTAKVVGKNGKVRYIYGDAKKGISGSDLSRASEELKKAGRVLTGQGSQGANLRETQRKASSRNTGGADRVHHPIMTGIKDAANNAVKNAGKAVSDGTNFVSSKIKDLGNTAMSALDDLKTKASDFKVPGGPYIKL